MVDPDNLISKGNKLVVNSIISPQLDFIEVEVSRSEPVLGTHSFELDDLVTDATVTISDGTNESELVYDFGFDKYRLSANSFPIVAGKTYSLSVVDQNDKVTASCTVPQGVEESSATDEYGNAGYTLKIQWNGVPNMTNYFHIIYRYSIESAFSSSYDLEEFKKDKSEETSILSVSLYAESERSSQPRQVDLSILSADENYYEYQKQLFSFDFNEGPFSEPVSLHSNIKGGLGLFGAYNQIDVNYELN